MRRLFLALAVTCMVWAPTPVLADGDDGLTADQIVDKVTEEEQLGFSTGEARVKLTIRNKRGQERIRSVNSKSSKVDGLNWTLVTFLEPADVAGTKLLAKEVKDGADLQYLYLPALKEKRRIAGAAKNESFMGTDFTYNDMEQRNLEDATHARLPDEKHSGIPCYVVESTPTDTDSEYAKTRVWVDKQDFLPLKIYFYDRKGEHIKTLVAQVVEPVDGKVTITRLMMKNLKKGSKTIMELEALDRNKVFPKSVFDENALDK